MRIKDIEITNFGVFGEKVKVDFSRYDPNDKILIIGENRIVSCHTTPIISLITLRRNK